MPTNILMPALSPTMTEGKLATWRKKEGDQVKAGDVLAEIETDKATMEVEAVDEGVLGKILVPAGTEGVAVNAVIAILANEGEDPKSIGGAAPAAPKPAAAPAPAAAAPAQAAAPQRPTASAAPPAAAHEGRAAATPLAKRMAQQAGLNLAGVQGSGPNGRIVKADIDAALSGGKPAHAPAPQAAGLPAVSKPSTPPAVQAPAPASMVGFPSYDEVPHSQMRKVIAKRLQESMRDAPHFFMTVDCQIDALLKLRADLNGRSPKDGPGAYKLSVNDFVIKAAAIALKRMPAVNAMWTEQGMRRFHSADISVAVAIPDGLITPIVRSADGKGLAQISGEVKDLAERARSNKLKLEEFQGGTFSISNLGMFGIKEFTAVINPPQACILAVGAGEQRPIVKDGALAVATIMSMTLSTDHRVVDGAMAAEFMGVLKKLIEDPVQMML